MMPPTHTPQYWSQLTCGWHSGDCRDNVNGAALDWGSYNGSVYDYNVRFRGWLYRNNTTSSNGYLILNVFKQLPEGSSVCDETVADVIEIQPWWVRYGMHYLHTNNSVGGGLSLFVDGGGLGGWNSPTVAYMIDDTGCATTGYHVHEWPVAVKLSSLWENRGRYPCCNYGGGQFTNNYEANKTHIMQFWQGHAGVP